MDILKIILMLGTILGSAIVMKEREGSNTLTVSLLEKQLDEIIHETALQFNIPPEIALAVAMQESGIDQTKRGRSGEIGIMQVMPCTAKDMGEDPHTVEGNIRAGVKYLRLCWEMHGANMLRCYNGGIGWNKVKDPTRKAVIAKNTAIYDRAVKARISIE